MVTKTRKVEVKVTKRQYENMKEKAEKEGKNLSQYIRELVLEDANLVTKILETHNMAKEIKSILRRKNVSKING